MFTYISQICVILSREDHGDLVGVSYLRYMRDMCEDLKGLYFVIMENRLRE